MRWSTCLLVVGSFLAGACGGSDRGDEVPSGPDSDEAAAEADTTEHTTTTSSTSTSSSTTTTTESRTSTTTAPNGGGTGASGGTSITTLNELDGAAQAWVDTWQLVNDRAPVEELRRVATENGSGVLETRFQLGDNPPARRFNLYPTSTANDDGTVTIDDCTMVSPPTDAEGTAVHYRATIENVDGSWIVTNTELVSREGCVPAVLAAEIIADYEFYWDAQVEIWGPADPTHPELFATTAGSHLDGLIEVLTEFEGFELRGRPETHPEITRYESVDRVEIADCQLTDPERGLFDVSSGERSDEIARPVLGQRDGREATLERIDGRWKVTDRKGSSDISCDFAPTELGLDLK